MKRLIKDADRIPAVEATPVVSLTPVVLPAPGRPVEPEMRVSMPATGSATGGDLPLILLSHGHGASNYLSSLRGCAPLAEFWAAHGFVVIQPTHLNSKALGLGGLEAPLFWRSRARDMTRILEGLGEVEAAVPGLAGRLDRDRIAVAGYSLGGHTASLLFGGEHGLGGIAGYDAAETTDENPDRAEAVARMTWAYLRSALTPGDPAWAAACAALTDGASALGIGSPSFSRRVDRPCTGTARCRRAV